jgi:hypothetical protein
LAKSHSFHGKAQNKAEGLSDEVIHVVSGFQVAGFQHVIGCLLMLRRSSVGYILDIPLLKHGHEVHLCVSAWLCPILHHVEL